MKGAERLPAGRTSSIQEEIERFLRTGEHDLLFSAWPGNNLLACAERGDSDLREALIAEVRRREKGRALPDGPRDLDITTFTRRKVEPMVRGLFPGSEQEPVLDLLERSVVFLSAGNIERILREEDWLHTAWDLANLYLVSIGAEPLSDSAPRIVGLSEDTTCYVSMEYFEAGERFADFVVHEVAHIFHNCKRRTIGLPETRRREWLLAIEFRKRETFAYACEAYSRILELGATQAARRQLLEEHAAGPTPSDDRVDWQEYVDILREAATARNGWKRILRRCSPQRSRVQKPSVQPPQI
jgi:hypothetical protein